MNPSSQPIGVFDSGIGGLTVVKQIMNLLPYEDIVYFGDIARLPYGTKSVATIKKFAEQTVKFLLQQKVKAIVIACNTISAVAKAEVEALAEDIPVIDVISCGSLTASANTINKNIGIIATPATVNSRAYIDKIREIDQTLHVFQQPCTLFVPLIEEGYINHKSLELIASEYLTNLTPYNIDTLVLGCTHYPIIQPVIKALLADNVTIIDPAISTAHRLQSLLAAKQLLNNQSNTPKYDFFVTEIAPNFLRIGEMFLQIKLSPPQLVNVS